MKTYFLITLCHLCYFGFSQNYPSKTVKITLNSIEVIDVEEDSPAEKGKKGCGHDEKIYIRSSSEPIIWPTFYDANGIIKNGKIGAVECGPKLLPNFTIIKYNQSDTDFDGVIWEKEISNNKKYEFNLELAQSDHDDKTIGRINFFIENKYGYVIAESIPSIYSGWKLKGIEEIFSEEVHPDYSFSSAIFKYKLKYEKKKVDDNTVENDSEYWIDIKFEVLN